MKRIPANLKINPTILKHWFLGDGYCFKDNKNPTLRIYTCAFERDHLQDIVIPQLKSLGIECAINGKERKYSINIYKKSQPKFYEYIGPCPVECYLYKWPEKG